MPIASTNPCLCFDVEIFAISADNETTLLLELLGYRGAGWYSSRYYFHIVNLGHEFLRFANLDSNLCLLMAKFTTVHFKVCIGSVVAFFAIAAQHKNCLDLRRHSCHGLVHSPKPCLEHTRGITLLRKS